MRTRSATTRFFRRVASDEQGVTAVVVALSMTVLMGFAGLAVDVSLWYSDKRTAQGAADSAAYSAAVDRGTGDTSAGVIANAKAITAQYGLTNGVGGVVVAVNVPPASGPNTGTAGAVEVVVTKTESLFFSSFFIHSAQVSARAVAVAGSTAKYCVESLDPSSSATTMIMTNGAVVDVTQCGVQVNGSNSSALYVTGGASLKATTVSVVGNYATDNGGSVTATGSTNRGAAAVADPYLAVAMPTAGACTATNASYTSGNRTISPGTYCGGLSVGNGSNVTLNPGVYIVSGGTFSIQGGSAVTATGGVTIVLTGSSGNYATAQIANNATLNLTAPTSGATAGLAMMGDRNAPTNGVNSIAGGAGVNVTGSLYFPHQSVSFSNGSSSGSTCTQLIAYDVGFVGGAKFGATCAGTGVLGIGAAGTTLVE